MNHAKAYRTRFLQVARATLDKMVAAGQITRKQRAAVMRFVGKLSPIGGHTDAMMAADVRWFARRNVRALALPR